MITDDHYHLSRIKMYNHRIEQIRLQILFLDVGTLDIISLSFCRQEKGNPVYGSLSLQIVVKRFLSKFEITNFQIMFTTCHYSVDLTFG